MPGRTGGTYGAVAALAALVMAVALALVAAPAQAVTLPAGFSETTVLTGLNQPTAVRFSQDGRIFVAEKEGRILEFDGPHDTTARVWADLRTNTHSYLDRGLLGIALDPSFPTRNVIYALYTYDASLGQTAPVYNDACADALGAGCRVSAHLSRLAPGAAVFDTVLLEDWCQQFPSHSIGSLAFGPDGMLYVSGGDGASYSYVDFGQGGDAAHRCADPPNEGGALRSQDLRTAGDPVNLNGAVLRIDPATGAGAPGNPFASSADANARRIIAYGLRNPFRIAFRPGTSELWVGDVGWGDWEEIDRIPAAGDAVAENFGWPCYEGANRQSGYDGQNIPLCETLYGQAGAVTPPFYAYRHSDQVVPGEACPVGGSSVAGLAFAFYGGGPYPAEYDGALFFSDFTRRCVWTMARGGTQTPSPSNIKAFVGGAAYPVDLQVGRDGLLYYLDIYGGTLRRIDYSSGTDRPPVAVAAASPTSGPVGVTVQFDGTGSRDPDGGALTYAWDLNGNGTFETGNLSRPTRTYTAAGTYRAQLRVTDPSGATATDTIPIAVGTPTPQITAPATTLRWKVGDTISFSGSAKDNAGADIPPSGLSWELVLKHGACPDCHEHLVQTFTGVSSGSFTAVDHEYPSELELRLTATDSAGLKGSTSLRLQPATVPVSFGTSPTGLTIVVNGSAARATPFTRTFIVGSSNTMSTASPQQIRGSGKLYFQRWSDGSTSAVHPPWKAPADASTYTATFVRR